MVPYCKVRISLNDESLLGYRAHEVENAGVRMVPESRGTLPSLSVRENRQLGGLGLPRQVTCERIDRALERFPKLKVRLNHRSGIVTGVEKQMQPISSPQTNHPHLFF